MAPTEHEDLVGRLERALDRGSRLLAITHGLQAALRPADVADVITHHARAALGTFFAGIALVDTERRAMAYLSMSPLPDQTARAWQVIPLETPAPVTAAVRTGNSFFFESVAEAEAAFPGIATHMRTAGTGSMAHLPLISGSGERLGTLALTFAEPRRISASEREFMTTVAGYTSQAIERALLFEQKLTVAEALQGSVLPTRMPRLEQWEVLGRFEPGAVGMEVGGDWFDAFTLPDGRLGCAVGDATGHGLRAARVMSAVRNALRAYAVLGGGPATVLTLLDTMLMALQPESMATVLYLELDPSTGEGLVSLAGHPPPLRWSPQRDSQGSSQVLDLDPDPPLGCTHEEPRRDHPVHLGRDDLLLLYTDGLIERRDEDIFTGLARLASTLTDIVTPSVTTAQVLEQMLGKMLDGSSIGDDVCALVVRHTRDAPAPATRRTHLPPRAHSVAEARRLAREALTEWGVARRRDEIVLAVSELVTNAVTHAETSLTLQLEVLEGAVRVTVVDQCPALPEHQLAEPVEEHGRGVHLVELVSDRWGTTTTPDGKCVWAEFDLEDGAR